MRGIRACVRAGVLSSCRSPTPPCAAAAGRVRRPVAQLGQQGGRSQLQRGVEGDRRRPVGRGSVEVGEHLHGGHDGGQQARDGGAAGRRVLRGELGRELRPPRVGVPPVQFPAAQAGGAAGDDQRPDDARLAAHRRDQVRLSGALVGADQRIGRRPRPGQDDEVGAGALRQRAQVGERAGAADRVGRRQAARAALVGRAEPADDGVAGLHQPARRGPRRGRCRWRRGSRPAAHRRGSRRRRPRSPPAAPARTSCPTGPGRPGVSAAVRAAAAGPASEASRSAGSRSRRSPVARRLSSRPVTAAGSWPARAASASTVRCGRRPSSPRSSAAVRRSAGETRTPSDESTPPTCTASLPDRSNGVAAGRRG